MYHGFVKTAAAIPKIQVADVPHNVEQICQKIDETVAKGAKLVVFPELCITGYTCEDLFWHRSLLVSAKEGLFRIADYTKGKEGLFFVGLPWMYENKLYNVAAAVAGGKVLGIVPKTHIPNYNEFYEARHFQPGFGPCVLTEEGIPFGTNQLFCCKELPQLTVAAEVCEDLWVANPPSISHSMAGATVLVNLSASNELTGKDIYRRQLVMGQSARLVCAYLFASAGDGESTTDLVFSGHSILSENGTVLAEATRYTNETIYADVDVFRLEADRRRMNTFGQDSTGYHKTIFSLKVEETALTRHFPSLPFVPADKENREKRCEDIIAIQVMGLKKRLEHTHAASAVLGISGGLDSTLALLITVRAFDCLELPRSQVTAVTMPCFGTTDRTYQNACKLTRALGATLLEVPIQASVLQHFQDIGQDPDKHDVTYENAQARERTQVLMDIANQKGGMVIGTGDMSELALGWATYNGDHMSMYGVNGSVPKTLVRHLVQYFADACKDPQIRQVLLDVLDTPVSPELLPPKDGKIAQKTENLVGPYELHDFFLYYMLRFGYEPAKIFRLARRTFAKEYSQEVIRKWLKTFYRRFFAQQFKRSCLPDGPKVGTVAVSPRGDLRMPSDASAAIWMEELETL